MFLTESGDTVNVIDKQEREDRRRAQREGAEALEASGAVDELFAQIDAGQVEFDGKDGLIQQLIKVGLERGLRAELTEHVGYEQGDRKRGCIRTLATARLGRRSPRVLVTSS